MVYIKGRGRQPVEIIWGDSEQFNVSIYIDDELYTPEEGDVIKFILRDPELSYDKSRYLKAPVMERVVPIDSMQLELTPQDTAMLKFKNYEYEMKIYFADGDVKTFVKASPFVVTRG